MKFPYFYSSLLLIFLSVASLNAQVGGESVFLLMDQSPSARTTAMGGTFISVFDNDVSLALQNPALINEGMHNRLSLNYVDYLSDIKDGYAGYARHFEKIKTTFNAGIQYRDYGTFALADEIGNSLGTFDGNDYALTLGAGRTYAERFHYGVSATFFSSKLESYNANGAALTLAGAYHDSAKGFTASLLFKNVGTQFDSYVSDENEPLPFDLQAGLSKRLPHTPFLFSLVLHDLYRWNLRYNDPGEQGDEAIVIDSTQQATEKNYTADEIFLHTIFGLEIYFGKAVRVNVAYNHQRRQELAFENRKGLAGFSFGATVNVNLVSVGYGRSIYNVAGGMNHLSLALNMNELFGKNQ